jgi:VWFA-related protein
MRRVTAAICFAVIASGALVLATQTPATQQKPTFKAGVNFVRVDVYPTRDGRAVPDLKQDEFEVLEDSVPQRIETFERINVRLTGGPAERAEPSSVAESNDAAADPRNRLFVLFLDTYHTAQDRRPDGTSFARPSTAQERAAAGETPPASTGRITHALAGLLDHLIGPDDLLGIFTPEMPVDMVTFTRRPASIEDVLARAPWQRLDATHDRDEREQMYRACYPKQRQDPLVSEMIARRREMLVLGALRNLVIHLENVREDRKAVLLVSQGWHLYGRDVSLGGAIDGRLPGPPPVGISPGGQLTVGETNTAVPTGECDRDRAMLADLDNERDFRDILNTANRANVTFYPIDPSGLRAPIGSGEAQENNREQETLLRLASVTDGIAVVDTNDLDRRVRRIIDDLSSYYLLGYNSTNAKLDGKFRKITVRVNRPGVTVRARPGYNAPTEAEMSARAKPAAPRDPEEETRGRALSSLGTERTDRPLRLAAGYGFDAAAPEGQPRRPLLWVVGELDPAAARTMEWSGGGEATIVIAAAGGQTVATTHATTTASAPRFSVQISDAQLKAGDYLVKVRLQGKSGGAADESGQVRVSLPDVAGSTSSMLGQPMLFRRGPFTGAGFQPTADLRFRKAERIRVDVPLAGVIESNTAQLLDRKGQPLPLPVTAAQREEGAQRFATADLALAPLAPGDYLIEVSVRRGEKTDKVLVAFRMVP